MKILFIISLSILLLLGYEFNSTIINGDRSTYNKLFKKLNNEKNLTSDILLEKSLLRMLLEKKKKSLIEKFNITTPKNSSDYKKLFENYLNLLIRRDKIKSALEQNRDKIKTIEKEIRKLDKNSTKALTLELQDALYHKSMHSYQQQLTIYSNIIKKIEKILMDSLPQIEFDNATVKKEIEKNNLAVEQLTNNISALEINKEQVDLLGNTKESLAFAKSIKALNLKHQKLIKDILSSRFLLFASALQHKNKNAFALEKELLKEASQLKRLSSSNRDTLTLLLHNMENSYLGRLKTLTGSGEEELKTLWLKTWNFIIQPIFHINNTPINILKLLSTFIIFIAGFMIGSLYKRKIKHITYHSDSFTSSTQTLLANLGYYLIVIIAFFIALNILGIKLSSLALVAGALSVGIGFGLQNIVSNFVSGLILMFERSVKIGDFIQLDDNLRGYISDIRMRSTTITTNDNIDVIIPNQKLIQNNVINWTMNDNIRRFSIPFGVAYGTDAHKVIDIVSKAVLNSKLKVDIVNNRHYPTSVIMTEMADSSVNFELLVWVKGEKLHKPKRTASEFLIIIYDALNSNNIEIPFPQRDLHIRSVEDTFIIKQTQKES